MLSKDLLLAFIIGSSIFSVAHFFTGYYSLRNQYDLYNTDARQIDRYYFYTIIAPIYLGMMSTFAILLHHYSNLSIRQAFLIIGITSAIIVSIIITHYHVYQFTKERLFKQYLILQLLHNFTFSIIVANLYLFLK